MYVHSCFLWTLKLIDLTDILLGSGSSLETTRVTLCLHWHTTTLFLSKGTCCNDHCTSRPARWLRSRAQPSLGGWNWGTPLTYNTPSILSSSVEILSAPANCPSLVALQMYPPIQTVSISISNAIVISSHTQVTWQPSILSRMVCRLSAPRLWGCTPCGPPHLLTVHVSWRINPISSSFYEQLDYEFGRDGWAMCVRQGRFMADLRLLAIWWCQRALCWTWRTWVKMIYCLWTSFIPSVSFLHRPSDTADSFTQVSAQMSLYQEDDHQWLTTNPTIYTPSSDGHLLDFCLIGWASLLHFVATPLLYSCLMYLRPPFLLLCAMPDYQNLTSKSGIYSN